MSIELGLAKAIDAETFGQPGQRTFRLRIIGENAESASLWMEKEQFQALSLALGQVQSEVRDPGNVKEPPFYEFPEIADHDFKVGRMALGLDTADRTVVLYMSETEAQDDDEPTLRVRLSQDHWGTLRGRLDEIIARGRPLCPLCNAPMVDGGHACIRGNGHSARPIPEEDRGAGDDA